MKMQWIVSLLTLGNKAKEVTVTRKLFFFLFLASAWPNGLLGQELFHPPELVAFATELRQWRNNRPDEVPDFSAQVARHRRELSGLRHQLHALRFREWPVHARVDYLMLQAELDYVDFELNVIREHSKNPNFYVNQAVRNVMQFIGGRFQAAPGITVPYDTERASAIVKSLEETEAFLTQAPTALTEAVPELADVAIERMQNVRENYAEFAQVVSRHLPEPHASQIGPIAEQAAEALHTYRLWLQKNRPTMKESYVIGRPAFEWYVQRVMMFPYDSQQLLMQADMERNRNWAFLQFERQKNRNLPHPGKMFSIAPLRPAATNQEYSEWKDATDVMSRIWAEEYNLFTHPEELGPMRHGQGAIWIEPFGLMAFPERPLPNGSYAQFVVEPDHWWAHSYWILGHRRDPGDNHLHNEYPGHRFESTVSEKHTCMLRRGHRTRGDSWCYYVEEMQLQLNYPFIRGPRARELMYGLAIMRAERIHVAVKMADGTMAPNEVVPYMMKSVPWMEPYVAKQHELYRKLVRPADVLYYQVGRYEVYKLLRDQMRKLGDSFSLGAFHDRLLATGRIPVSLARLEIMGANNEIDYLSNWSPIPTKSNAAQ